MKFLLIGLGGFLGATARYLVYYLTPQMPATAFPLTTLGINSLGCFFAGFFFAYLPKLHLSDHPFFYVMTIGFLGSFTTFSAFAVDTMNLFHAEKMSLAFGNILGNLCLSILAVFLGHVVGRYLLLK